VHQNNGMIFHPSEFQELQVGVSMVTINANWRLRFYTTVDASCN